MSSIYYGQTALEGAVGGIARLWRVNVHFGVGQPRTNGKDVWLPSCSSAMTLPEFEAAVGTGQHEVAHCVFGTAPRHKKQVAKGALEGDCYNAVADIADETRLEWLDWYKHQNRRAGELFRVMRHETFANSAKSGSFDANSQQPMHWKILVLAMHRARGLRSGSKFHGVMLKLWAQLGLDISKMGMGTTINGSVLLNNVWRCLHRAKTIRSVKRIDRTSSAWARLVALSDELTRLLEPFRQQEQAFPVFGGAGGEGMDGHPAGIATTLKKPGGSAFDASGAAGTASTGGTEATKAEGEKIGTEVSPSETKKPATPKQQPTNQGGGGASNDIFPNPYGMPNLPFDEELYRSVLVPLRSAVVRLANSDRADDWQGGYTRGAMLDSPTDAMIDGRCMSVMRPQPGEKCAAAILLDKSGSMYDGDLIVCAAAAEAFGDAIQEYGVARRWYFESVIQCTSSFRKGLWTAGGTMTAVAVSTARDWLKFIDTDRKWIVCLTDGLPGSIAGLRLECERARSEGIGIIAMGMKGYADRLAKTMPGAQVIAVDNVNELAMQLSTVALTVCC